MTLHSVRGGRLYVAPIRLGLGVLWVFLARLAGVGPASALLAFGGGVFVIVFVAFNDPRTAFLSAQTPEPVPTGAHFAGPLEQALRATLPSTAGVTLLAAAAISFEPVLAALLGGISAGLGVAGILSALRADPALYVDRRSGILYRR